MSAVYVNAAASLTAFLNGDAGLRSLLFSQSSTSSSSSSALSPSYAKEFALVNETLRYVEVLDEIIDRCQLMRREKKGKQSRARIPRSLLLVQLYDLLFGAQRIEGGGQCRRFILQQRTPINACLARIFIRKGASNPLQLLPASLRPRAPNPRYVRINTLLISVKDALTSLQDSGFSLLPSPPFTSASSFYVDPHVPSLLVFPPQTTFHENELYRSSALILQDKASCFPAVCLDPNADDVVVDGCAAPGNKTSHLLAVMRDKQQQRTGAGADAGTERGPGIVTLDALEVHSKRFDLLCEMMHSKGAQVSCVCTAGCHAQRTVKGAADCVQVTVHHTSFLNLDGRQGLGVRVTTLLLDPTCSGSGMPHTIDAHYKQKHQQQRRGTTHAWPMHNKRKRVDGEDEEVGEAVGDDSAAVEEESAVDESLASLSAFQVSLLLHAFTLPALTHLVYSTCSVHVEENEAVVARALETRGRALGWEVETGLMPAWSRRGLTVDGLSGDESARMIRCDPNEDLTNGFFVCGLRKRTQIEHTETRSAQQRPMDSATNEPTGLSAVSELSTVSEQPRLAPRTRRTKRSGKKRRKTDGPQVQLQQGIT